LNGFGGLVLDANAVVSVSSNRAPWVSVLVSSLGVPLLRRVLGRAGFEIRPNGTMWRETPL
jgi:hypothetical protein